MTDKEKTLFKDWKNKNKDKIEDVVITLLDYEKGVDTKTCYDEVDWLIQKAFLAGLKAGRPQWHDLRKDPNDLLKRNNELTDRSNVIITDKGIAHYNFRKQKWYVHNFEWDMSFSEVVIAWYEIPTFTDKV